ncbi:MAG: Asp-tRNA(Asn)/Glu-tRNA(Gln) amidotransferase subunit GatC [Candidatus Marsarchaeota archaeon]|nr:Asp-tRNA(Asn)/Glu-tRNA(Gln) amidotransferase subunit GatC [Candidatus Marsarchaeota archaeon]
MDDNEFDRLAKICRLRLTEDERKRIMHDTGEILSYFNTIEDVNCEKYPPAYQPVPISGRKRPDKVSNFKDATKLLKNSRIYRFFVVGPKT